MPTTFEYKEKKINTIVMEIENTGADQYNINGVDLAKAVFLFRRLQETTRTIPLADYSITVLDGNQWLNINDGDTKDTADIFQVVYEEQLDSSQYNPIGEPDIYTLNTRYNEVQQDLVELWEAFRTSGMKSDITDQALILPLLQDGESWYWDEDANEYRGIGVATVELNIAKVEEEGDFQVQRVMTTGDGYIITMTALKDETEAYKDTTLIYRNETEVLRDETEAIRDSIASQDAQITQNATDIGINTLAITDNANDIVTNASAIGVNSGNISTNSGNISNNTNAIVQNETDISNNATGISTNSSNISTNSGDISDNSDDIGTLSNLDTSDKSNLVNAINEVKDSASEDLSVTTLWSGTSGTNANINLSENINKFEFIYIETDFLEGNRSGRDVRMYKVSTLIRDNNVPSYNGGTSYVAGHMGLSAIVYTRFRSSGTQMTIEDGQGSARMRVIRGYKRL